MTRRLACRAAAALSLALGLTLAQPALSWAQSAATPAAAAAPANVVPATATAPATNAAPAATAAPATTGTTDPTAAATPEAATVPADLSVKALVRHADRIVKGVLLLLFLASIVTWTMLLAKGIELWQACRGVGRGLRLAESDAPDGTADLPRALRLMRHAVSAELAASEGTAVEGTKERLDSRLRRLEMRLARHIQRGTGILATIGAVSPFVGLFGTVWGIMNSFVGIAKLHTTNLAVVAPGIAEALLATAAGLVAAIPAVVIYNIFARWVGAYRHGLGDLGEIVLRHTSRTLDRGSAVVGRTRPMAAE
ncbi:tonB-system energizer ExbB [Acidisoma cellulosilyticum]|uniref:tonB-system energizer ExbB n=1 Tax=Acidisoma cellulosilyticum TaxID=2802395 RepID=UPI001D0BD86C|nr:tonB-system energizer ExbB [Acidisoma cellulosilyticum]